MDATRSAPNRRHHDGCSRHPARRRGALRCLNHTEENRIKRIYQRHSYQSEMKVAWNKLGETLESLRKLAGIKEPTMLEEFLLAQKS
jgi:hypothetical protein